MTAQSVGRPASHRETFLAYQWAAANASGMAERGVAGWLVNKTRCADARVPVAVSEMMKRALRNCTARFAHRLECNGNI
jgi:hypothetical protein